MAICSRQPTTKSVNARPNDYKINRHKKALPLK
jgi:hypothetical protein